MRRSSIESVNFVSSHQPRFTTEAKTNAGQRKRERERAERLAQENYRSVNSIGEREKISKLNKIIIIIMKVEAKISTGVGEWIFNQILYARRYYRVCIVIFLILEI